MARFNELLNTGAQLSRGLGILLGLQEQEGVTTSAPELMPIFDHMASLDRISAVGWVPLIGFIGGGVPAGGVGFRSQAAIDNPAGSNQLFLLERIHLTTPVSEAINVFPSATQLGVLVGNFVRDTRQLTTAAFTAPSGIQARTQNNTALTGVIAPITQLTSVTGQVTQVIPFPFVIGPGHSLRLVALADNTAINSLITFIGRSRGINPRELIL